MHPVDQHVGKRIRHRRLELELQQEGLAALLGISTQQVHKYETGFNRVSASRLYDLSQILGVSIDYFFRGLETNIACTDPTADRAASAASGEPSHLQRIEIALGKITRASLREKVVILIEAMASDSNELH